MALTTVVLALAGYLALRATLDRQINASLLSVASLQAASVTDDPSGEMHFHEWDLTPAEAIELRDLNRSAAEQFCSPRGCRRRDPVGGGTFRERADPGPVLPSRPAGA
jgi:hypothetical protein